MAVSTKDQIQAQAMSSFQSVEVTIGSSKAVLRELSHAERQALDASNFQTKDGELVTRVDPKDGETYLIPVEEKRPLHMERWIAATINPTFTVEEIAAWPVSLKKRISDEAKRINNIEVAATTAKNS